MHFIVHDVFSLHFSHQHVSATVAAIFSVKLLREYKGIMWLVASSLHNKKLLLYF
jgi:hypothetical protein